MKYIWTCRRTGMAFYAVTLLAAVMAYKGVDVSMPIASIAVGLGAANSYEKAKKAAAYAQSKLSGSKSKQRK